MREALLVVAMFAIGCTKPTEKNAPAPAASAAPAGPVADTDAFRAELKASGPFKKGEAATFVIRVEAKAPFHVNDEYPAKFTPWAPPAGSPPTSIKPSDVAGVKYAEPKLERNKHADAFATEPCNGSNKDACVLNITVRFTADAPGTVHLGGVVDVGVCNKDQCLIEKKPLDITVNVT
jgi:hypothetical protein